MKNIRNSFASVSGLTFYYDETNSIRKLKLRKDSTLNNELREFILGGVAFKDGCRPNPEGLLEECGLSRTQDVKSNSFFKYSDFTRCLESKRLTLFLNWLVENELYIHFYCQDNLYFNFSDLVDPLLKLREEEIDICYLGDTIKSDFYQFAVKNLQSLFEIFNRYSYPEVSREDVNAFCLDLFSLIEEHDSENESSSLRILKKSLAEIMSNDSDFNFIREGESGIISDNFAFTRVWCMIKAPDCKHIFDQERDIENLIEKLNLPFDYEFVDSKGDRMIQICDIVVKFVYKYMEYVKSVDYKIPHDRLKVAVIDNFRKIQTIIERSYVVSINMIEYSIPQYSVKNSIMAIDNLLLFDEVLTLKSGTKTISDFDAMKERNCMSFDNEQNWYISYLEDVYISKFNGKERLFSMLGEWSKDAQTHIMNLLIDRRLEL